MKKALRRKKKRAGLDFTEYGKWEKRKEKKHMITLVDTGKAFDKTQNPFMIGILSKLVLEGKFLNLIKNIYKKP